MTQHVVCMFLKSPEISLSMETKPQTEVSNNTHASACEQHRSSTCRLWHSVTQFSWLLWKHDLCLVTAALSQRVMDPWISRHFQPEIFLCPDISLLTLLWLLPNLFYTDFIKPWHFFVYPSLTPTKSYSIPILSKCISHFYWNFLDSQQIWFLAEIIEVSLRFLLKLLRLSTDMSIVLMSSSLEINTSLMVTYIPTYVSKFGIQYLFHGHLHTYWCHQVWQSIPLWWSLIYL